LTRTIEFRAIPRCVEVIPDTEIALLHGVGLHGQGLRPSAAPLGLPFREDLRADDEDRDSKQDRVLEPRWFEREVQESLHANIDGGREAKHEHDERQQRRGSAEHLARQEGKLLELSTS